MEYFKIEKNVKDDTRVISDLLKQMEIGDSFAVPKERLAHVRAQCSQSQRQTKKVFRIARQSDGHYRCFRVE